MIDQALMRVAAILLAGCLGLAAQSPAQTAPPPASQNAGTASLTARVVAADTGSPVRFANVRVTVGQTTWAATTDESGRFTITGLPAGRCTVRVAKPGFLVWLFGRERGGSPSRVEPFDLRSGEQVDRGALALPRGGVIAGRVFDAFGEPAINVDVRALRYEFLTPGEPRLGHVQHATTNDLGDYRIYGLPPGRYYVGIGLAMSGAAARAEQTSASLRVMPAASGAAPTFYPGTATAGDATLVLLPPAGEARGIDVRLQVVPLAALSGRVTNSRGEPASGSIVMINPARTDGVLVTTPAWVEPDAAGAFSLVNIPPGDYRIDVVSKARMEAIGQSGTIGVRPAGDEFASVPVTVAGQNVDGLAIRTASGFDVEGRVVEEKGLALPPDARITVSAGSLFRRQGLSATLLGATASAEPDGRFVLRGLAGPVLTRAYGLPRGWGLKAVRLNGADVTDEGADIRGDLRGLEVVVTATPAIVSGTVQDAAGAAVSDYAGVIVFSADPRRWTARLTRHVAMGRPVGGRFTITGLPAGDYYAAAVDILEPDWPSPDSLERLRSTATPFTLSDGEAKTLTIVRKH
jgi:hypothetical protein